MCFSATASFATAAVLLPFGLGAACQARRLDSSRGLPLALTPLLFGIQQALEGVVWLAVDGAAPSRLLQPVSLAYLGFAFALWPLWLPCSALRWSVGLIPLWRERIIRLLAAAGLLLACVLWLPLLVGAGRLAPQAQLGSIDYQVRLSGVTQLGHQPLALLYALVICLPLLLAAGRRLRWLAAALAVAFALTEVAYQHAFSSVWCFFSALLSLLVVWALQEAPPRPAPSHSVF